MRVAGVKAGVSVTVTGVSVTVDKLNARRVVSTLGDGVADPSDDAGPGAVTV